MHSKNISFNKFSMLEYSATYPTKYSLWIKSKILLFFAVLISIQFSCKKAVEVDPPITGLVGSSVFASNATAVSALSGIYDRLVYSTNLINGTGGISLRVGLYSDELKLYSTDLTLSQFYTNSLNSTSNIPFWSELYNFVYNANSAIEGLSKSNSVTPSVKQQLLGEAKFMRAFFYFYLVNLYGNVPLILSSDYRVNLIASRTDKAQVYQQIIIDLKDAQNLLSSNYVGTDAVTVTSERVRPNKWAATALLARAYLFTNKYDSAEAQATIVINNTASYNLASDLNNVFLKNSSEAIFQLQPVNPVLNTYDGNAFILTSNPGTSTTPAALSTNLVNAFEVGDNRFVKWVGSYSGYYYPNKYKVKGGNTPPLTEYYMVLRLAEQYLIRAEARAQQGNVSGAASDLNTIRNRAGLPNTIAATQAALVTAVQQERQVELFTEMGHRWFDLKRTGTVDVTMTNVTLQKGGQWNTNWQLFPIPNSEILIDHNLTQNPGYQ